MRTRLTSNAWGVCLAILVIGSMMLLACDSEGENRANVPEVLVSVGRLANDDVEEVWLLIRDAEGKDILASEMLTDGYAVVSLPVSAAAFDVIAYSPDVADWEPSLTLSTGWYAASLDHTTLPASLSVLWWNYDDGQGLASTGIAGPGEPLELGAVHGTITDTANAPVADAVVRSPAGQWSITDATGEFRLENLPAGSIVLTVEGPFGSTSSYPVEIVADSEVSVSQMITLNPDDGPYTLSTLVVDHDSDLPLSGAKVTIQNGPTLVTDEAGRAEFQSDHHSAVAFVEHEGHSVNWRVLTDRITRRTKLRAIPEQILGEWAFCHRETRNTDFELLDAYDPIARASEGNIPLTYAPVEAYSYRSNGTFDIVPAIDAPKPYYYGFRRSSHEPTEYIHATPTRSGVSSTLFYPANAVRLKDGLLYRGLVAGINPGLDQFVVEWDVYSAAGESCPELEQSRAEPPGEAADCVAMCELWRSCLRTWTVSGCDEEGCFDGCEDSCEDADHSEPWLACWEKAFYDSSCEGFFACSD